MTACHKALIAFLEGTGLPVYLEGTVAPLPQFPYMTLSASSAAFCGASLLTVTAWHFGSSANAARHDLAQSLRELIPEEGVILRYDGGMSVLRRGTGDFISLMTDETEPIALGLRIRLSLTCYDP